MQYLSRIIFTATLVSYPMIKIFDWIFKYDKLTDKELTQIYINVYGESTIEKAVNKFGVSRSVGLIATYLLEQIWVIRLQRNPETDYTTWLINVVLRSTFFFVISILSYYYIWTFIF